MQRTSAAGSDKREVKSQDIKNTRRGGDSRKMARLLGGDAGKERRRWRDADRETRQEAKTKSKQNMGASMFTSRRFGKGGCGRDGHGHRVSGWVGGSRWVDGWMSPGEGTLQVPSALSAVRPGPEDSL
jgi:hypothetical protein